MSMQIKQHAIIKFLPTDKMTPKIYYHLKDVCGNNAADRSTVNL